MTPVLISALISHNGNGNQSAPGVNNMKKEMPQAYTKLQDAWNDYTTYTSGERGPVS